MMKAIRVHPNPDTSRPYTVSNVAPSSSLVLDIDVEIPDTVRNGEILIKVEATTIVRDALTWPETYDREYITPGNDFAGTVIKVNDSSCFEPGDEVFGMTSAVRAGTWAEYAVVLESEAALKPKTLNWVQAAAVPLSGLTAYEALFEHAGVAPPSLESFQKPKPRNDTKLLILGASGGVGLNIVQLARLAGLHIVAATRSNERNGEILKRLGADDTVEFQDLSRHGRIYDIIIDTVGGQILKNAWSVVSPSGIIVSIESLSFDFDREHRKLGLDIDCKEVRATWFVVSPSQKVLEQLSAACDAKLLEPFVATIMPLAKCREAYDGSSTTSAKRGKTVLIP